MATVENNEIFLYSHRIHSFTWNHILPVRMTVHRIPSRVIISVERVKIETSVPDLYPGGRDTVRTREFLG